VPQWTVSPLLKPQFPAARLESSQRITCRDVSGTIVIILSPELAAAVENGPMARKNLCLRLNPHLPMPLLHLQLRLVQFATKLHLHLTLKLRLVAPAATTASPWYQSTALQVTLVHLYFY